MAEAGAGGGARIPGEERRAGRGGQICWLRPGLEGFLCIGAAGELWAQERSNGSDTVTGSLLLHGESKQPSRDGGRDGGRDGDRACAVSAAAPGGS